MFHKLERSGSGASDAGSDADIAENSFYGLGAFGVYESAFVPARLGVGVVGEMEGGRVGLALGQWAVPEHAAFCRGLRVLQLGVFKVEIEALRMQFLQICGAVEISGIVGNTELKQGEGGSGFEDGDRQAVLHEAKTAEDSRIGRSGTRILNRDGNRESISLSEMERRGLKGMETFKKTLPAPTKSEIVIRNRISAQRSNEKRRRKIEATKLELAYLKTSYLPQLEVKRGCLISENQSLRLKFMERYQQSDIDSFF